MLMLFIVFTGAALFFSLGVAYAAHRPVPKPPRMWNAKGQP